ncbi:hypothetical protein ACWD5Q_05150 [Streptomyces sp. NPDC002513]
MTVAGRPAPDDAGEGVAAGGLPDLLQDHRTPFAELSGTCAALGGFAGGNRDPTGRPATAEPTAA